MAFLHRSYMFFLCSLWFSPGPPVSSCKNMLVRLAGRGCECLPIDTEQDHEVIENRCKGVVGNNFQCWQYYKHKCILGQGVT